MAIEKSSLQTLTFTGDGCRVQITDQVVCDVDVPGGRQTINFPVIQLSQVHELLTTAAADADVAALIVANTPVPPPVAPADPPVTSP